MIDIYIYIYMESELNLNFLPEPKQSAPAKKLPRPDEVKPGSAYSDSKGTWTFDGTKWSDGKNFIDNPTGYKNFIVALQKGKAIEA